MAILLQLTFHVSLCTFDVLFDMSYFFFLELVEEDVVFLRDNFDFLLLHFLKPLEFFDFVLGGAKLDVQLLDHSVFLLQQSCVALPFELQPLLQLANLILQLPALLPQLLDLLLQLLHLLPAQLRFQVVYLLLLFGDGWDGSELEHIEGVEQQVFFLVQFLRSPLPSCLHFIQIEVELHRCFSRVFHGIDRLDIDFLLLLVRFDYLFVALRNDDLQLSLHLLRLSLHL